jgi:septal ring factor EnvC (AmiA/AmiB activator)
MFKLWIDRKGVVRTCTRGSLEQQYKFLVRVLKYLQERVNELEHIISAANASCVESAKKRDAKHAAEVRRYAQEMGILQKTKGANNVY